MRLKKYVAFPWTEVGHPDMKHISACCGQNAGFCSVIVETYMLCAVAVSDFFLAVPYSRIFFYSCVRVCACVRPSVLP